MGGDNKGLVACPDCVLSFQDEKGITQERVSFHPDAGVCLSMGRHFVVVGRLVHSNEPQSYVTWSLVLPGGRVIFGEQVCGEDPDKAGT